MRTHNSLDNNLFISYWNTIADPPAGADRDIAVPTVAQCELVLLTFQLVADANVADRYVNLNLLTGVLTIRLGSSAVAHKANETWQYLAHQNAWQPEVGTIGQKSIALPSLRIFDSNAEIQIEVANMQAADQITDIYLYWKMWLGATP